MNPQQSNPYRTVALAYLFIERKRFWLYCLDCQFNRFVEPDAISKPLSMAVPDIGLRMMCPDCLSRNIHSKLEWFIGNEGQWGEAARRPN